MKGLFLSKIIPVVLGLSLLVPVLSGCGSDIVGDVNTAVQSDRIPLDVSWWGNDGRHEYTMNGIDLFCSEHPEINVQFHYGVWSGYEQRNRVNMRAHTEADLMQINYAWLSEYSADGEGYYDLRRLSDVIDLSQFDEKVLKYGTVNGKLNGIPIAMNTPVLVYNDDLWNAYGLSKPERWEDFLEAAKVMREDGIYPLGMVKKHIYLMLLTWFEQSTGKRVFGEDGTCNLTEEEWETIIAFYRQLVDEKALLPVDEFDKGRFGSGAIAASVCWVSDTGNYCGTLAEAGGHPVIGDMIIPEDAVLPLWYIKPATLYAISRYSEHPVQAAEVMNFLLNDPRMALMQKNEKGVPVSRAALKTLEDAGETDGFEYEADRRMKEHMDQMYEILPVMENDKMINGFKTITDDYLYDKVTLQECAQNYMKLIQEIGG